MKRSILSVAIMLAAIANASGNINDYCNAPAYKQSMPLILPTQGYDIWNPSTDGYLLRSVLLYGDANNFGAMDQLQRVNAGEKKALLKALSTVSNDKRKKIVALEQFLAKYPASKYRVAVLAAIGDEYFFCGDWEKASLNYSKIDSSAFNGSVLATYRYRYALALLKTGRSEESRQLLKSLLTSSTYFAAARFYLSYLDYVESNYNGAMQGFADSGLPSQWYEVQIAFAQGKYKDVASQADRLYSSLKQNINNSGTIENDEGCPIAYSNEKVFAMEMARVAGESYFKIGEYEKARPLLVAYLTTIEDAVPTALFSCGVIEYLNGDYARACELMQRVAESDDMELADNAWLYVGQCMAHTGNNTAAAMAFEKAWNSARNHDVGETAMYDYIVAMAKGGNVPFASSAGIMEQFLIKYPTSKFTSDVRKYLGATYYIEKDYAKALEALDKIVKPTSEVRKIKQLVLYELGCSEQSNSKSELAAVHLRRAAEMKEENEKVATEAYLWLGQALYDQGKWKEAQQATKAYLDAKGSKNNRGLALYDLAYAYYQEDKFKQAAEFYDKAYADTSLPSSLKNDALLRSADCWYYAGNYSKAWQLYSQAGKNGGGDVAYALFRAAKMKGLQGDRAAMISDLESIVASYPDSKWTPGALMELAEAYVKNEQMAKAEACYKKIITQWPSGAEAPASMLRLALLYGKKGNTENAIEAYKQVIARWPSSDEAKAANTDLRRVMGENDRLQEYVAFMNSVPGAPKVDASDVERIAFETAENRWAENANVIAPLEKYIVDYPDGTYLAPALYDLAFSYAQMGKYEKALSMLDQLLEKRGSSSQVTDALLLKAEILENNYPQKTAETLEVYKKIEARGGAALTPELYAGLMRLSPDADRRLFYARKVLQGGSLSADLTQEATFYEGEALIKLGRKEEGVRILENLAANPSTLYGARAAVALGEYLMSNGKYAEAQKELLAFTDKGTSHYYWLARGYIALADAYAAQGLTSTAKEYIKALRQNYPGKEADIREMINTRLNTWK